MPFRIPETIHARLNGAMLMNLVPLRRAFRSAGWWPLRGRNGTQAVPYEMDEPYAVQPTAKFQFGKTNRRA